MLCCVIIKTVVNNSKEDIPDTSSWQGPSLTAGVPHCNWILDE